MSTEYRKIIKKVENRWQSEGMGARVRRSIGTSSIRNLDPFLLLDEFSVQKPAGFPDHPHRGFETVTYMIKGRFRHEDFCGHKGTIAPGDLQNGTPALHVDLHAKRDTFLKCLQAFYHPEPRADMVLFLKPLISICKKWMTAGRGIVHCEMPDGDELAVGLQLWINLSKENKMIKPAYQELLDKDIPKVTKDGVTVKVIAGESFGIKSPVYTRTPTMYLDFKMKPGSELSQHVPDGWNGFAYMLSGTARFGPDSDQTEGPAHHTLQLGPGNTLIVKNKGDTECHFVLIAGKPLNEPVFQYGPFVMNSQQQIEDTFRDYQSGTNGFENAHGWKSKSGNR